MYGTRSLGASFGAEVLDFQLSAESWKSSTSAPKLAPNERVPYMKKASNRVFNNCTDI